jgi:hypothetical protein
MRFSGGRLPMYEAPRCNLIRLLESCLERVMNFVLG